MLSLRNITKDYATGDTVVKALKGVSLDFRNSEFVSILGASGCGKTTLLNIVGGLDRYTSGDLIINAISTKKYKDSDWDTYRNHTIGFVFQTYNLIMHQTVLGNVELALTLSGVSPKERKEMAIKALDRVGLSDQINKKPNQLSGGQMQRVAIARAIVNNPDIILADEPTGALDTQTSVQIMEILKELSKDRLVIMVTHNPELAEQYSTRIVRLSDGELLSDTNPVTREEFDQMLKQVKGAKGGATVTSSSEKPLKTRNNKQNKTSMSFLTALSLSLKNLLTKKARTILVSFAGSIGIIGIALILSLSDGFQMYINKVQEDTLSSYPLTIEAETADMTAMLQSMMDVVNTDRENRDENTIYANNLMNKMMTNLLNNRVENNLRDFKQSLENNAEMKDKVTAIKYGYSFTPQIYFMKDQPLNKTGKNYQVSPNNFTANLMGGMVDSSMMSMGEMMGIGVTWSEMLDNETLIHSQYDLLGNSRWPTKATEVVVVVDSNEEINDYILYALGLIDPAEFSKLMQDVLQGKENVKIPEYKFTYDQILGLKYKLMLQADYYKPDTDGVGFTQRSADELNAFLEDENNEAVLNLEVVGIVKPKVSAAATAIAGTIGYLPELTQKIIDLNEQTIIVNRQLNMPETNVFTGEQFINDAKVTYALSDVVNYFRSVFAVITPAQAQAMVDGLVNYYVTAEGKSQTEAEAAVISLFSANMQTTEIDSYESNLRKLGYVDKENPSSINIFAQDFESKDYIVNWITDYNKQQRAEGNEENVISYTDYIGLMMASISDIISGISYILIGFVSISLVVSSIMIGVITYISVLERTKEIGILRSIGASKRDISRVFNAETFIVGLTAGVLGVVIAGLLDIPINMILEAFAGLYGIAAIPLWGGVALVVISVFLTLIAGIIPSRFAAKKDPVIALRSE